jgi:hypothetical protein
VLLLDSRAGAITEIALECISKLANLPLCTPSTGLGPSSDARRWSGITEPLLDDTLWKRIERVLPKQRSRNRRFAGRKPIPDRAVLTGILFVLRSAAVRIEYRLRARRQSRRARGLLAVDDFPGRRPGS